MNAIPVLILALCAAVGALVRDPTPDDEALDRLRRYFGQIRLKLDLPNWAFKKPPTRVNHQRSFSDDTQLPQDMPSGPWNTMKQHQEEKRREVKLQGKAAGQAQDKEDPCQGLPQLPSGAIPIKLLSDDLQRLDDNKDGAMNEAELERFFMSVEILQLCSGLTKEVTGR